MTPTRTSRLDDGKRMTVQVPGIKRRRAEHKRRKARAFPQSRRPTRRSLRPLRRRLRRRGADGGARATRAEDGRGVRRSGVWAEHEEFLRGYVGQSSPSMMRAARRGAARADRSKARTPNTSVPTTLTTPSHRRCSRRGRANRGSSGRPMPDNRPSPPE